MLFIELIILDIEGKERQQEIKREGERYYYRRRKGGREILLQLVLMYNLWYRLNDVLLRRGTGLKYSDQLEFAFLVVFMLSSK